MLFRSTRFPTARAVGYLLSHLRCCGPETILKTQHGASPSLPLSIFHPPSSILYAGCVRWKKITIVGMGLLGGSLGLVARKKRLAGEVAAYVRRPQSIKECERAGAADYATTDLLAAVSNADLVILCTPLAQMRELAGRMLPALKRGAIVSDVGSVKGSVVAELEPIIAVAGAHFVGAHPMAGGERSGVGAASVDLFRNAVCVLTPTANSDASAVRALEDFWRALGSRLLTLTPELHDELVARCSHLPHVVAAELVNYVLSPSHPKEQAQLCANGFRDTTRIAAGSPEMWRDIALANGAQLSQVLDAFIADLQKLQRAIQGGEAKVVEEFFATARQRREGWSGQASPSSE